MTAKATILEGDVIRRLRGMQDCSVHCVVTSPPYWGLRDYGVDGQMGLEATPAEWLRKMVRVFREVRRVLRKDGTCWVNIGDCYAASGCGGDTGRSGLEGTTTSQDESKAAKRAQIGAGSSFRRDRAARMDVNHKHGFPGVKAKDLMLMPARLALALQRDGWWVRRDIVWHKENAMPESAKDRPWTAHEYLFMLTKSRRYFYCADAIQEPVIGTANARGKGVNPKAKNRAVDGWVYGKGKHESLEHARARTGSTHDGCKLRGPRQNESFAAAVVGLVEKRNKRSVWRIPTEAFADAHFATFPRKLVEPCILSGCPVGGVVLDPFAGSGTTGIVALEHGREFVGIELNPEYCRMAKRRIEEARPLFNRVEIDRTSNTKARRKRSCERHEGKDRA